MAISTYTPSANKIVHWTSVDFSTRPGGFAPVHLVQYDQSLPIIAVNLYNGGQVYKLPSGITSANILLQKSDGTFVSNPVLGCNSDRSVLYFEVTYQMLYYSGIIYPVLEIKVSDKEYAASSQMTFVVDKNPVQEGARKSSSEWKGIEDMVDQAKAHAQNAASSASSASASASQAKQSETNAASSASSASASASQAKQSETNAASSASSASTSASQAKQSETNAASSASSASTSASQAKQSEVKAGRLATDASLSAASASEHADRAEAAADGIVEYANDAAESANSALNSAKLSESWAVGGTGERLGEDENNSKYWSDRAQAYSEQAKSPAKNTYSVVLTDSVTSEKYALVVDNGRLGLLGVSEDLDSVNVTLIDQNTAIGYNVLVEDGKLKIQEVL